MRPNRRDEVVGRPSQKARSDWEAFPEGWKALQVGGEALLVGREAFPVDRVWTRGLPGGPGVVVRPPWMAGRSQ